MAALWKSANSVLSGFPKSTDVEKLLATENNSDLIAAVENITSYVDDVISTTYPDIAMDGSNPENDPPVTPKPQHACNKPYSEVENFSLDLLNLIATCQCHTWCSAALRVSLCVPKTPAASHHHHHRERRPQPHYKPMQMSG